MAFKTRIVFHELGYTVFVWVYSFNKDILYDKKTMLNMILGDPVI